MKRVLITSASRKISLYQEFAKVADTYVTDISPVAAALHFVPMGKGMQSNDIAMLEKTLDIDLIIPTRDGELQYLANNAKSFNARIMVATPETIETCLDKHKFYSFCIESGFNCPQMVSDTYPQFIRSKIGSGSTDGYVARNKQEWLYYIKDRVTDPIRQKYIEAPEYTIDLFADFKGTVISVVPRKRIKIFGGESFIGRTEKNWPIINECIKLAEALKLIGHNTIQCFLHEGKVKFIEVNPRYGGGCALCFAAGVNTPAYLIDLLQGKRIEPLLGMFTNNLVMMRYTQDVFK
jgi:carbamoyl-phosphate synthase large subunit